MILIAAAALALAGPATDCAGAVTVCTGISSDAVELIAEGKVAGVIVDARDDQSVLRVAEDLKADLALVAGPARARLDDAVIVGTLGNSEIIDRLVAEGRLDAKPIAGQWEAYVQQVVERPAPGIDRALVIAGSDPRGAIYGAYDLSARMGVSPWHWWADVPVTRQPRLMVTAGTRDDRPVVRYRGIFLNDEDPALKGWATATFGGFNAKFYGRVFELILRLKGNFLWPAMWGKAFYDDDPANKATARRYDVVIGTSHHEPLMRAHVEWERYGKGPWDYTKNEAVLRDFWREGVRRARGSEHLVTIGMRGDGDEPMTEGTAIGLLERIVADQRAIIAQETGKPAAETPQVWALYKEVQDYYDKGMRVPDDVTLLFADDNWGNIRRLPKPGDERAGGFGVYYHFDYVGGPRNYKWINTNQVSRTWEQMRLAYANGADRLWIVNVGDLKPMELPTSFFLDLAWDPLRWPVERMADYHQLWAAQQFGSEQAAKIGDYLDRTTRLLARRKPELIDADTWSLLHFREAERVLADYDSLEREARATAAALKADQQDAYYQLVLHPIEAAANLNRLYVTVARNRLYASQGRAETNELAAAAETLFAEDARIAQRYESRAGNKWVHMMDQTHIGYTGWQQPPKDVMPRVEHRSPERGAAIGVAVEGEADAWTPGGRTPKPLRFERFGQSGRRIEIFNRGTQSFDFSIRSHADWLVPSVSSGRVERSSVIELSIDWDKAPPGISETMLEVDALKLPVRAINRAVPAPGAGFIEADGHVTFDATHFARSAAIGQTGWTVIPQLGRTGSAITVLPQAFASFEAGAGPSVEFPVHLHSSGEVTIELIASPSLDVIGGRGLRYAIAIDDEPPQVLDLLAGDNERAWGRSVIQAARIGRSRHNIAAPGAHVVRLWAVDSGVVVQRLTIATRELPQTALGPPASQHR
jgi:hypothetical protein